MTKETTVTINDRGARISTLTKVSVMVCENGMIRLSMNEHMEDDWKKRPQRTNIDVMLTPDQAEALGFVLDVP
jgi:hypothetical protein